MKKYIITFLIITINIIINNSVLANEYKHDEHSKPVFEQERCKKENDFFIKLNLSDEQKIMAKKIRLRGHEELKPYMQKLSMKQAELNVYQSNKTFSDTKKVKQLNSEINELNKKIHEIRRKNMKQFESILTKEQLHILEDMKKNGREKYRQEHTMQPLHAFQNRFSF